MSLPGHPRPSHEGDSRPTVARRTPVLGAVRGTTALPAGLPAGVRRPFLRCGLGFVLIVLSLIGDVTAAGRRPAEAWVTVQAAGSSGFTVDLTLPAPQSKLLSSLGLKLEESGHPGRAAAEEPAEVDPLVAKKLDKDGETAGAADAEAPVPEEESAKGSSRDIVLMELAVRPGSLLEGRSASDIQLRTRYGLNLLAVSRHGERALKRLRLMALKPGDLLLMQGPAEALAEFAADMGCVPLAQRELQIPNVRRAWMATGIMVASVGAAALGLLPAAVAFALGVLASMAFRTVPLRAVYESIDWPVIVLLGALIPVAAVMESTGTADLIARVLLDNVAQGSPVGALVLVLVVTMFLSDLINNAATAAVMCPIAMGTSVALGVSADAFLMAVAIGASCAFLTPIGHQNNTLILGPGGFRFGDYWRLGLAVEVIVVAISVPMLLWIWPLMTSMNNNEHEHDDDHDDDHETITAAASRIIPPRVRSPTASASSKRWMRGATSACENSWRACTPPRSRP